MSSLNREQFWKAIKIWLKNSHVVNRRLSGVIQILNCEMIYFTGVSEHLHNVCQKMSFKFLTTASQSDLICAMSTPASPLVLLSDDDFHEGLSFPNNHNEQSPVYISLQRLLTRSPNYKETYRISILDFHNDKALFINVSDTIGAINLAPDFPYYIKLDSGQIVLDVPSVNEMESSLQWLKEKLLPRIRKWALSDSSNNAFVEGSLNLVSLDKYNFKYQELKLKYGQEMVKIWPENTDPSKFVFEDVAIASYLLLLWEEERILTGNNNMQSFVDLGCGNGLLVYILNSEGHPGRGVDVRKRGIWDLYPDFVKLEVEPVTPSENCLYKDIDWLIGNHSDELTPWIPVLAARSSYNCRFFLLPCCAFDFDGNKYQRKDSSKSQYNEYLEFIKVICNTCGIETKIDRLKIPSTKRICLVGTDRLYSKDNHQNQCNNIQKFIDNRCINNSKNITDNLVDSSKSENDNKWAANFTPREGTEKVRNCTKIEKVIVNEIVSIVTANLLKEKNYSNGKWNSGGCIPLGDLVKYVSPEKLKLLKNECGGLQTLLRNNHHIFEVVSGKVRFRYPRTRSEVLKHFSKTQNSKKKKTMGNSSFNRRPCWFYVNHPDGCPLTSENCSYLHTY